MLHSTDTAKRFTMVLCVALISTLLLTCFLSASANTPSVQTANIAGAETQFKMNIAYAYVGKDPANVSYTSTDGILMAPITEYPSAVMLNTTCLIDNQITSCDAEIEVYKVQITTNTGVKENHCYFVGLNYNPAFSKAELSSLFDHVKDLSTLSHALDVRGDFKFNWTQNKSFLSQPIGFVGCYGIASNSSDLGSADGLWQAGIPQVVSVTVHRIGYITMMDGSVSIYKDTANNSAVATQQLSKYGDGFLYNNLIPAEKLPQNDLFHPSP